MIYFIFGCVYSYEPILKIIDERWALQLHRPLHAAAYHLNLELHYNPDFKAFDLEIKAGLYQCITRIVLDVNERLKIDVQLDSFKNATSLFGNEMAKAARGKKDSS